MIPLPRKHKRLLRAPLRPNLDFKKVGSLGRSKRSSGTQRKTRNAAHLCSCRLPAQGVSSCIDSSTLRGPPSISRHLPPLCPASCVPTLSLGLLLVSLSPPRAPPPLPFFSSRPGAVLVQL